MNGMNQGDFLLDFFDKVWNTYAVKKAQNPSSKASHHPTTKSRSVHEGEHIVPPVISMEGEGVVPPVISMEGPPEEPVAEDKGKQKQNAVPKRTEEVPCSPPLPRLARELSAPNGTESRAWLTQAVVAKELLSTPAERRKARHERMMRRLHRQRGE